MTGDFTIFTSSYYSTFNHLFDLSADFFCFYNVVLHFCPVLGGGREQIIDFSLTLSLLSCSISFSLSLLSRSSDFFKASYLVKVQFLFVLLHVSISCSLFCIIEVILRSTVWTKCSQTLPYLLKISFLVSWSSICVSSEHSTGSQEWLSVLHSLCKCSEECSCVADLDIFNYSKYFLTCFLSIVWTVHLLCCY